MQAIQTFRNHFESILYGCDPGLPKDQWNRLIDVAVTILNAQIIAYQPKKIAYNET